MQNMSTFDNLLITAMWVLVAAYIVALVFQDIISKRAMKWIQVVLALVYLSLSVAAFVAFLKHA